MPPPRLVLLSREDIDPIADATSRDALKDWLRAHTGATEMFLSYEATCLYEGLMDRGPWTRDRLQYALMEIKAIPIGGKEEIAEAREEAIIERTRACECSEFLRKPLNEFMAIIPYPYGQHRFLFLALSFVILLSAPVGALDVRSDVIARPA